MEDDTNYWISFTHAWDQSRFLAYLDKWLSAPERTLGEIKALCVLLGYDLITEHVTLEMIAELDKRAGPAETPTTA